jgi:hypothetical protein
MTLTAKYTWTPDTPLGFLNDEIEQILNELNTPTHTHSGYVVDTGDTMTGTLTLSVAGSTIIRLVNTSATPGAGDFRLVVDSIGDIKLQEYVSSTWYSVFRFDESADNFLVGHNSTNRVDLQVYGDIKDYYQTYPKGQSVSGTSVTIDWDSGSIATITLSGNTTFNNPSNIKQYGQYQLIITPHATSQYTVSWGTYWGFPDSTAPDDPTAGDSPMVCSCVAATTTAIKCSCVHNVG